MALIDVKVPQLSESVAEATLLQWKKQPGQAVAADEILIAGELSDVCAQIKQVRAQARLRKGWIMDTYLLRRRRRGAEN